MTNVEPGGIIDRSGLDDLIDGLKASGYRVLGPLVRDGVIVHGEISATEDLPVGVRDSQSPGAYRLSADPETEDALFDWAVGPASWKSAFFPPEETVWRASKEAGKLTIREVDEEEAQPVAVFGARPCEVAAMGILDRVMTGGTPSDPGYERRRAGTFVVAVECGAPASTCFCTSMGTGPGINTGYDLAVTELKSDSGDHRYLVRVGSERGAEMLAGVSFREIEPSDERRRYQVLADATVAMTRVLDTDGLPEILDRNIEHPRWEETAQRCLSCGNCTMVCPTCFCSDVHDVSDLEGTVERRRVWASCFDRAHSYIHGGPVRPTTSSSYRQWMTHKLGTWWDQFGSSGCVGCGRCITWCPVGIDITEEAASIRASDGETKGTVGA